MAQKSMSLPVTPDSTDSRRGSTGKLTSSKDGEKKLPNYLRASTGSCHDLCKYGKKHASDEKERRPFPRRAIKKPADNNLHSPEIQIQVLSKPRTKKDTEGILLSKSADSSNDVLKAALSSSRKATLPGRLRQSADSKFSRFHDSKTSPAERLTGSLDGKLSGLIDASSQMKRTSSRERKKAAEPTALRNLPDPETNLASKTLKKGMPSSSLAKLRNPSNQASPRAKGLALSEKLGSSFKPKLSSSPNNCVAGLSGRRQSDIGTGQKSSVLPKVALRKLQVSPKPLLSPRLSGAGLNARRQSDIGTGQKSSSLPKLALRKLQVSSKPMLSPRLTGAARALASPRVSLSPKSSLAGVAGLNAKKTRGVKVLSTLKNEQPKSENKSKKAACNLQPKILDKTKEVTNNQRTINKVNEAGNDMVEEKTLYVIKMETEDKHMESDLNERLDGDISPPPVSSPRLLSLPGCSSASSRTNEDEEGSEYSLTDGEEGSSYEYDDETESMGIEQQKKWNTRNGVVSSSGDVNPQPVKLRFRRGRVIEIKSENDGPRRLKFRRGRGLSEDKNLKAEGRLRYRSRVEADIVDAKKSEEKVVLRHQDVDGRKDGGQGGLFNNVIEETASKLAETRKSKVKALVGAFETVISLQDVKPSGNVFIS